MRSRRTEYGSSVVMFVVALPLLLVFLFAVVDLGRAVFLHMAVDDAAYAACRAAAGQAPDGVSESMLRQAAVAASPALDNDSLSLDMTVRYGDPDSIAYEHRWYDEGAGAFASRPSHARRRTIEVACTVRGAYLTPLGTALSLADGRDGTSFEYRAEARGVCDETVEGGVS